MTCYRLIAIFIISFHSVNADQSLLCGDWDVFKDEKCYKVIVSKELQNIEDAKKICYQNEASSLVTIRSQEEQDFLYNLLLNVHKSVNDIWIGAQYIDKSIKWSENITLNYTNWANGYPRNDSGYECVLIGLVEPTHGKWMNEPCERDHAVVCQKQQNWLFSYLQKTVMELRESYENLTIHLESTKQELEKTKIRLTNTEQEFKSNKIELNDIKLKVTEVSQPGTIAYFTKTSPPIGWLKANGQSVSRSEYTNLFNTIGTTFGSGDGNSTFSLPDLRGEFIRGWSDGRDVDKDRTFGSFQWGSSIPMADKIQGNNYAYQSAYQEYWRFAGKTYDNGFETSVKAGEIRDGITYPNDNEQNFVVYLKSGDYSTGYITTWTILKGTRPRNIALLACIKY